MSNNYERWTQDPATGQSHLWRWNEQTQNWDWVTSHPAIPDGQEETASIPQPESQFAANPGEQPEPLNPTQSQPPIADPSVPLSTDVDAGPAPTQTSSGQTRGRGVKIALAVLVVVLALAVGGFFAYRHFFPAKEEAPTKAGASNLGNGVKLAWQYEVPDIDSNYNQIFKLSDDKFALLTHLNSQPVYMVFSSAGAQNSSAIATIPLPKCALGKYSFKEEKLLCEDGGQIAIGSDLSPTHASSADSAQVLTKDTANSVLLVHQAGATAADKVGQYWVIGTETAKQSNDIAAMLKDAAWAVELVKPSSAAASATGVLTSTPVNDSKILVQYFNFATTPQPQATIPAPAALKADSSAPATATPSPTESATQADAPLTKTHCTKHNKICFDYPANAHIEEQNTDMSGADAKLPASADKNVMELGTVVAADGTELITYMDNWLGQRLCEGQVKVTGVWPINLPNNAGRPAAISAGVTKQNGEFTAQLYATNDPRLEEVGPYDPYDQCVYFLVQPNTDGSKEFTWFQVANATKSSNEADAIKALGSQRYQRALKILQTLRSE